MWSAWVHCSGMEGFQCTNTKNISPLPLCAFNAYRCKYKRHLSWVWNMEPDSHRWKFYVLLAASGMTHDHMWWHVKITGKKLRKTNRNMIDPNSKSLKSVTSECIWSLNGTWQRFWVSVKLLRRTWLLLLETVSACQGVFAIASLVLHTCSLRCISSITWREFSELL